MRDAALEIVAIGRPGEDVELDDVRQLGYEECTIRGHTADPNCRSHVVRLEAEHQLHTFEVAWVQRARSMFGEVDPERSCRPHRGRQRRRAALLKHAERLDDHPIAQLPAEECRRERASGAIRSTDEGDSVRALTVNVGNWTAHAD